uniref:hypothetical protein n=1 Tax=Acinetobacter baumannii TaxID=470 RepID=UPI003394A563
HSIFHVSALKKCIGDPESIFPIEGVGVNDNIASEYVSVHILDKRVKKLRNTEVVIVKVL